MTAAPKLEETSIDEQYAKVLVESALAQKMEIPYSIWKKRYKQKDFYTKDSVRARDQWLFERLTYLQAISKDQLKAKETRKVLDEIITSVWRVLEK